MRPAPPPAGRHAAHGAVGCNLDARARDRLAQRRHDADRQARSGTQMQGDVSAVVHVRMLDSWPRREHRRRLVGHRTGHRRHRCDESASAGPDRADHAKCNRSARRREVWRLGASQAGQLIDQSAEPVRKDAGQRPVGVLDCRGDAAGTHDQVDWPVLQEQTVAVQPRRRRAARERGHMRAGPHRRGGGVAGDEVRGFPVG